MSRTGGSGPPFIDSHVHLADSADLVQELAFARSSGSVLLAAGIDAASSRRSLALSEEHPSHIRAFVGVHPSEAEREGDPGCIRDLLRRAAGVGEVGLDPKYSEVGAGSHQMKVFRLQLGMAEEAGKPAQVHSRGAERACLEEIGTFRLKGVLLHWFQGEDCVPQARKADCFVSFGPALLVSKKLQRIAASWERDRVLVESDGPVRFSALGDAGGSWLVPSVVFRLAELWGEEFGQASRRVAASSLRFLGWADGTPLERIRPLGAGKLNHPNGSG